MKKTNRILLTFLIADGLTGAAYAEFGVSAGATFNYKADFRSAAALQPRAADPRAAIAGVDHFYDDGYNRVDSSGNFGSETTYWGYQNVSQDNGGSLTMNSSRSIIDEQSSSGEQSEAQPAIEVYWQKDLTTNEIWNIGVRTAVRWQKIEVENRAAYRTTVETISDTYSSGNAILPGAPFDGSFAGPNMLLSDIPTRTTTYTAGPSILTARSFDADLFAADFGPTISYNVTEKLRLSASSGGTISWMDSDFDYTDGSFSQGGDNKQDWLLGAYASADLSYLIGEQWGIFGGAAYTCLEDFEQDADGRSAELQFGDSYTLRAGLFFR